MEKYDIPGGWQITSRYLVLSKAQGTFWFRMRLWGRLAPGLTFTDTRYGWVPFSVRYGFEHPLKIGCYHIAALGWGLG